MAMAIRGGLQIAAWSLKIADKIVHSLFISYLPFPVSQIPSRFFKPVGQRHFSAVSGLTVKIHRCKQNGQFIVQWEKCNPFYPYGIWGAKVLVALYSRGLKAERHRYFKALIFHDSGEAFVVLRDPKCGSSKSGCGWLPYQPIRRHYHSSLALVFPYKGVTYQVKVKGTKLKREKSCRHSISNNQRSTTELVERFYWIPEVPTAWLSQRRSVKLITQTMSYKIMTADTWLKDCLVTRWKTDVRKGSIMSWRHC